MISAHDSNNNIWLAVLRLNIHDLSMDSFTGPASVSVGSFPRMSLASLPALPTYDLGAMPSPLAFISFPSIEFPTVHDFVGIMEDHDDRNQGQAWITSGRECGTPEPFDGLASGGWSTQRYSASRKYYLTFKR